ncbi:MATE family efflux transporter [Campylobacter upsaliensis]|uniref:MATE family efflux transporter n=1 Tax=Campylobacter upsaliensis TaxID=28080 RepID=UPI0022EB7152|nr:MATE family efflux transporter [Campylobacter upsaliensis]
MSNFNLSPLRLFCKYAVPNVISVAFFSVYIIIDGIFVGQYLGSDSLAALGLVMPFVMISFALSDMIAIGSSVQISMKLALAKFKEANRILTAALALIFALNTLMAFLAYFISPLLISFLDTTPHIQTLCEEVVLVFALFMPIIAPYFALDNYLRICGKTTHSMIVNIIVALSNIILDYLFIVVFGWGLFSAALASCIGFTLGTFLDIYPFFSQKLQLKFSTLYLSFKTLKNIIYNGSSEFFSNISASIFGIFANLILLHLAGAKAVATYSIILYIDNFITLLTLAMCEAMQPALSYHFAQKNLKHLKVILKTMLIFTLAFSVCVFALSMFYGEFLVGFFTQKNDAEFLEFSTKALHIFSFVFLIAWFNILVSCLLTAFNQAHYSLILSLMSNLFAPLIFILTLPYFLGLNGVWISPFLADFCVFFLSFYFLKKSLSIISQSPYQSQIASKFAR